MKSKTITIQDAQQKLVEFLRFASKGNEVIILDNNRPLAKLTPIFPTETSRIPGLSRGKIWMSEDFNEPLPEDFWTGQN